MSASTENVRQRLAGACLIAGPVVMAAAMALKGTGGGDSSALLAEIAADPGRFQLSTLLQLLAALITLPGLAGLVRLFPERGRVLGHLGVGLLGINLLGNLGDAAGGAVLSVLASGGVTEQETAIADAVGGEPVFVAVQLMVLVGMLGFVLLPAGQLLARTVHWAVPALILAALVSFFLPVSEGVGGVLLALGLGAAGVALLRGRPAAAPRPAYG